MEVENKIENKSNTKTQSTKQSHKGIVNVNLMDVIRLRLVHNLSYAQIADIYGVYPQAIHNKFGKLLKYFNKEGIADYEKGKGDILSGVEQVILQKMIDDAVLKKASFNNLAYGLQNVNNINRLHRGQATAILDSLDSVIDRVERKLRKAIDVTPEASEVQDNNAEM